MLMKRKAGQWLVATSMVIMGLGHMSVANAMTDAQQKVVKVETFQFDLKKGSAASCVAPSDLTVTVDRDHPRRETLLILPKDSKYQSAQVLSSDPWDPKATVRHYRDQLMMTNGRVIILEGKSDRGQNTNGGTWTEKDSPCTGSYWQTNR